MYRLELTRADVPAVVLRRSPRIGEWERGAARREALALEHLTGRGLGAPELLASDSDGKRTGRPSTLMTVVPGAVELRPGAVPGWVDQLAERLVRIHDVPLLPTLGEAEWYADLADEDRVAWMGRHPHGEEILAGAREPECSVTKVLAHGDYQHFNILWSGGAVSGVVDWTVPGAADPGKDVGHCMLNLAVLHGPDLALEFLSRYRAGAGRSVSRGWLLRGLLDFSSAWEEFIPIQVGGRVPVDVEGMGSRVDELLTRVVTDPV
jgi:aminoglycoside phosphotransferase (APT) family kinase protein